MLSPSLLALLLLPTTTFAFKANDFKTCSQSGFCRRGRALSARALAASSSWQSPYSIDPSSLLLDPHEASFTAAIKSSLYPSAKFELDVRVHDDGVIRVRMDEVDGLRKRYDEAASWALIREPRLSKSEDVKWTVGKDGVRAKYGDNNDIEVVVQYEPVKVTMFRHGVEQVVLNGRGLLHMEHFRTKEGSQPLEIEGAEGEGDAQTVFHVNNAAWFEGEEQDAWWEETFSSWTDSKPKGPESLSIDITFPTHQYVYGIPQHATNLSLPSTTGPSASYTDPYRLFNADVFEYLPDSPVSLYGSIPLMHAHGKEGTAAVFNAVGSDTWIDVEKKDKGTETHWVSESGILDVFILPGPNPTSVFSQYSRLTGTPSLPPSYSLAYHQCRWNYVSSDDVRGVQRRFDEEDMPVDVFWLDIEYSEGHKYFMWDNKTFPDPVEMIGDVEGKERKMVIIIDPHLKRESSYPIYKVASELGVLVKPKSGEGEYEGWCWPGSSSWIDFFNPDSWDMWIKFFKTKSLDGSWAWTQSSENVGIWNDMNEPSVFNGPEISMPRDNVHYGGWEHRDVHNINGMLFTNQTYNALYHRSDPPKRPFVLTRSFYAGSQRFGAMWTGDNLGSWEHMAVGVKMVIANGLGGMVFAGSDVGGFFGNADPEMLVRWYAVGAFSPFFRAHAHIDTKRREPYLLDEPYKGIVKDVLRLRYSMLPIWYSAFRESSLTGVPLLRPQYVMFPQDEEGFAIDDQFYVGSSGLLFKPVTTKGATSASVYLSDAQIYYDYFSHTAYPPPSAAPKSKAKANLEVNSGRRIQVPAALHELPLLIRGGSILPTRERPRRSSPLMKHDPFTLRIALDVDGGAKGEVYLDDGEGYGYEKGEIVWRGFEASTTARDGKKGEKVLKVWSEDLASTQAVPSYDSANPFAQSITDVRVERLVILGIGHKPASIELEGSRKTLEWEYEEGVGRESGKADGEGKKTGVLVIKDPAVGVASDWAIVVKF
ncbi:glycoside hydrolase family 31 protein [Paxillus rubicundulus Ve08.2h10]|uniref:Glucosidase II subunit alpha n=1 Tax=Paxillus rubicundulus Ve08.2h10 TaxID=930991 RepID=A0A0D0DB96_9AGAM|nr:glycoside hydrolase family 31 protein [Paxillus rubicundulus Ve08.2h10]